MERYIDANLEIERIEVVLAKKEAEGEEKSISYYALKQFVEALKSAPTADVEKVKHARWICENNGWNTVCSGCGVGKWKGYVPTTQGATEWMPRCPNCGAKMDEKEKTEEWHE